MLSIYPYEDLENVPGKIKVKMQFDRIRYNIRAAMKYKHSFF